jgi:translation initiation factor 2 beta subunit (eIF-2beta)/eIF-5
MSSFAGICFDKLEVEEAVGDSTFFDKPVPEDSNQDHRQENQMMRHIVSQEEADEAQGKRCSDQLEVEEVGDSAFFYNLEDQEMMRHIQAEEAQQGKRWKRKNSKRTPKAGGPTQMTSKEKVEEECKRVFAPVRSAGSARTPRKYPSAAVVNCAPVGSKKTAWLNFEETCLRLNRSEDHIQSFMLAELGAQGSHDPSTGLIFKGVWKQPHVQSLLNRYCSEYVQCSRVECNSLQTTLVRDSITRLIFVECDCCGVRRSVTPSRKNCLST